VDDEQDRLGIPVALGLHGDDFKLTATFVDADPQPRQAALAVVTAAGAVRAMTKRTCHTSPSCSTGSLLRIVSSQSTVTRPQSPSRICSMISVDR